MSLLSILLPPLGEVHDFTDLIRNYIASGDRHHIWGVIVGTKGSDSGKNIVVLDTDKVDTDPPVIKPFPGTLTDTELAASILAVEKDENAILRSYGRLAYGGNENWVAIFDAIKPVPSPAPAPGPAPAAVVLDFKATKAKVSNRGVPDDDFLRQLVAWGKTAPAEIFDNRKTKETDVYASVSNELGKYYADPLQRKACMLEILRVLAGFESSWRWGEGRDTHGTPLSAPHNEWEAGAWQVSANSMGFGADLKQLVVKTLGASDADTFRKGMMQNHPLAMEYIARLLRYTIRANGPVKRGEINEYLRPAAVEEFAAFLQ